WAVLSLQVLASSPPLLRYRNCTRRASQRLLVDRRLSSRTECTRLLLPGAHNLSVRDTPRYRTERSDPGRNSRHHRTRYRGSTARNGHPCTQVHHHSAPSLRKFEVGPYSRAFLATRSVLADES